MIQHQNCYKSILSVSLKIYVSFFVRDGSCRVICPIMDSSGLETGVLSVICKESTCCLDRQGKAVGACNDGLVSDLDVMSKL